jgi:16S rRNA (cytosine1402-N4)-methyltransferase
MDMKHSDNGNGKSIHKAVLLNEISKEFGANKKNKKSGDLIYLDGTLGGAGHALSIAENFSGKLTIIGLDQDLQALNRAKESLKDKAAKIILKNENFRYLDKVLDENKIDNIDLMLLDLGFSSDEIESSGKGFSFMKDEPLLMTFGDPVKYPFTAKDIVNNWKEEDIANVIFGYGEDRFAKRIAKKIIEYREKKLIESSGELAEIVGTAMPFFVNKARRIAKERKSSRIPIHPATKTFQALRIAVNDELNALREALKKGYDRLNEGGKMAVISFHSLEDRIVKDFFREKAKKEGAVVSKKPERASAEEVALNPRSRSAKLRFLTKKK